MMVKWISSLSTKSIGKVSMKCQFTKKNVECMMFSKNEIDDKYVKEGFSCSR